jgi:uncharacterized protein
VTLIYRWLPSGGSAAQKGLCAVGMGRLIHFEIHADNPERAMRFYGALFGWSFTAWAGSSSYWSVRTGEKGEPGIDGGLLQRRGPPPAENQPVNAYPCTVGVERLDETLARVASLGGQVAVAKMPIPGVGWLAYAKDTEGNIFGLMQNDSTAR